jgi:ATP-dependent Clp protease ATP-binding subunit ClpA
LRRRGQIDPLIGRRLELERMISCSCRAGSTIAARRRAGCRQARRSPKGLALRIHPGDVPEMLQDGEGSMRSILAPWSPGTRYRGDFEERVKQVVDRIESEPNAILLSTRIHSLVRAGAASGRAPWTPGNLPQAGAGQRTLRCIGSTTFNDVKQSFDKDRALSRRFQKIDVLEPSEGERVGHPQRAARPTMKRTTA